MWQRTLICIALHKFAMIVVFTFGCPTKGIPVIQVS
jgi:hypothetical protein